MRLWPALEDGSTAKLLEFLSTGQFTARTADEQVQASQLIGSGGPEIKAAARIALEGSPEMLHRSSPSASTRPSARIISLPHISPMSSI
ncbi:ALF repeat-containing protein [Streptomyces wuyuanensis]|uniref:ALF repeat-containing protein n=1 Tax=Streptomyces wuyuanensis TaxID=1196353 RepID=UPI00382809A5